MLDFFGRIHILILHLPIGILFLAVLLEWIYLVKDIKISKSLFFFIYSIGALSAIMACVSGYVLAGGYDYTEAETSNHFWAGIVTAILATLGLLINYTSYTDFRKYLSLAIAGSLMVTGHLGGSLTHGEGFLNPQIMVEEEEKSLQFEVADLEEAELYPDIIAPLLDNKCVSCHGPNKIKGKLRMDTPENLLANGKSGKDLLTKNGEMIRRIELPMSHDKHMPPDNKSQLSEEQEKVLKWWVANGASFEARFVEIDDHESIKPVLTKMIEESKAPTDERKNIPAELPDVEVEAPNTEAINRLKAMRVVVLPMGENSNFLEVNFVNVDSIQSNMIEPISLLSKNIVRLKMSDVEKVNDAVETIGLMSHLQTLYLDGSDLSKSSLSSLENLNFLNYLNVSNTSLMREDLDKLGNLSNLKTVYALGVATRSDTLNNGAQVFGTLAELPMLATDTVRIKY